MIRGIFQRSELLMGKEKLEEVARKKVILLGVGGVGSWCAESLVRSGIHHITLVDSDRVCVTNINRQIQATWSTVGEVKVEVLKKRLLDINPEANILAIQAIYNRDNAHIFDLNSYDYIIDAIDSLSSKVHLIATATKTNAVFLSSMGAALKIDPTRIQVGPIWKIRGCPLARHLRKRLRKLMDEKDFLCVYSDEILPNAETDTTCGTPKCLCPRATSGPGNQDLVDHEWCSMKAQINGTMAHIVAIFGFTLAGLVIQDVMKK